MRVKTELYIILSESDAQGGAHCDLTKQKTNKNIDFLINFSIN